MAKNSRGLGACGCPKGARKINAKKSGFRCFKDGKMVAQVKRRKAGEACWAESARHRKARKRAAKKKR